MNRQLGKFFSANKSPFLRMNQNKVVKGRAHKDFLRQKKSNSIKIKNKNLQTNFNFLSYSVCIRQPIYHKVP